MDEIRAKLKKMTHMELLEAVLTARKIIDFKNEQYISYQSKLKELKDAIYKNDSWDNVKKLLNAI